MCIFQKHSSELFIELFHCNSCMPSDFSDDRSTLAQLMAWCRQATSHYLGQCWSISATPWDTTKIQWVKWYYWMGPKESLQMQTRVGVVAICIYSLYVSAHFVALMKYRSCDVYLSYLILSIFTWFMPLTLKIYRPLRWRHINVM